MPERALSVIPSLYLISNVHTLPTSARFTSRQRARFVSLPPDLNTNVQNNESWAINAALTAGLYPKLLVVEKGSNKLQTLGNGQPVACHPSSVNFKKRPEDIIGDGACLMYFTLLYVRCCLQGAGKCELTWSLSRHLKKLYVWETSPVDDYALLLLCGDVEFKVRPHTLSVLNTNTYGTTIRQPASGQIIIDRKLKFQVDAKTALALKALRTRLSSALHVRLRGKAPDVKLEEWLQLAFAVLSRKAAE
jgi:ATP-dependent RNA helicase DHX29